ncbi:LLM class flavin-dependent oxidoreductase [Streptomyces sp. NPDC015171]|uniref:LLM class flavin-dependent oxidoreductase n=1 Tax=Streptomyces sp. NPDC015171 TaxID=3364945 RepID=UPI0036FCB197
MRFSVSIPQHADESFTLTGLRAFLRRAEELGFESAWTQESVLGAWPLLSPIEIMTYAAACTERMRLGCAVFVTPLHNPVQLAKSLATLDHLSAGRLEVGVATGGQGRPFAAFGIDGEGLVSRFLEHLTVMKALWTEPRVTLDGRFWQLDDAAMEPKPVQRPHPPVWFGAAVPNALRRAVRHGDGFFGAGSQTTARFAEQVKVVREALAEQGRAPATFPIAKRVYIAVGPHDETLRERARDVLSAMYGRPDDLSGVAVYGTPEQCVAGLREVAAAGAERILLTPLFDEAEQLELLAGEVLPAYRRTENAAT